MGVPYPAHYTGNNLRRVYHIHVRIYKACYATSYACDRWPPDCVSHVWMPDGQTHRTPHSLLSIRWTPPKLTRSGVSVERDSEILLYKPSVLICVWSHPLPLYFPWRKKWKKDIVFLWAVLSFWKHFQSRVPFTSNRIVQQRPIVNFVYIHHVTFRWFKKLLRLGVWKREVNSSGCMRLEIAGDYMKIAAIFFVWLDCTSSHFSDYLLKYEYFEISETFIQ